MITFQLAADEPNKQLYFSDVDVNQFFVDYSGRLCQKIGGGAYNIIALQSGQLHADHMDLEFVNQSPSGLKISRILPKIEKITF